MAQHSFYWHDYETFGLNPQRDRAVQFAGIRTDFDFNIIGEPLVIYCRPMPDNLPQPEACCVTGITPQLAMEQGLSEVEFIGLIHQQMAEPNTCTLGYNNLRFDDEVTRNLLYRNFYDPYGREWQMDNSRWDLVDLIRTMYALRPEGINWPSNDKGKVSLRLDKLTVANGIEHDAAHDALSDVYATIALAKLIKQAQPKLFDFFLENRGKHEVRTLLELGTYKPLVHVSGMYGAEKNNLALVLPICEHPTNKNGVIVYDLSVNPEVMLSLTAEEIKTRVFTARKNLPKSVKRIPLKVVHINKCPIIAPANVVRAEDAQRLNIDKAQCYAHLTLIKQRPDLKALLAEVFADPDREPETDPDLMIYSGGFFGLHDKKIINEIRELAPEQLADFNFSADDERLTDMFFRYRARNYPETLNDEEMQRWQVFCKQRLSDEDNGYLGFTDYQQTLQVLAEEGNAEQGLLEDLQQYGQDLQDFLENNVN